MWNRNQWLKEVKKINLSMTRLMKKEIQDFWSKLRQTWHTFTTQFVDTHFFPRFLNTFHSTRSRRKFSPPLVSNHACEFLVGPTQNRDEETKKSHAKKSMHTKGRGFQFVWIYLNQFKIEMVGGIRLKFYYLIREKKGKRYILNKDRFCRSIIFYGANRVIA